MSAQVLELIETVETLSKISDLTRVGRGLGSIENKGLIEETAQQVETLFSKLLHCMKELYLERNRREGSFHGVTSIMALAFDVARNIDRLQRIEGGKREGILHSKSYQLLEEFYQKKISKKIDNLAISRWILGLVKPEKMAESLSQIREAISLTPTKEKRVYVDFEMMKKDVDYELVFCRSIDGTKFYPEVLLSNAVLINRLFAKERTSDERATEELLKGELEEVQDRAIQRGAIQIEEKIAASKRAFISACFEKELSDISCTLLSAFYALTMASRGEVKNLNSSKTHRAYWQDFCRFYSKDSRRRKNRQIPRL